MKLYLCLIAVNPVYSLENMQTDAELRAYLDHLINHALGFRGKIMDSSIPEIPAITPEEKG